MTDTDIIFPPNIKPLKTSSVQVRFNKREAQFGMGYRQTAGAGINNKVFTISLQFIVNNTQRDQILALFEQTEGYKPFIFQLPGYQAGYFTHGPYTENYLGGGSWRFEFEIETFNLPTGTENILAVDEVTVLEVT